MSKQAPIPKEADDLIRQVILTDLNAFSQFQQAQQAAGAGISYVLDLVREDKQPLVGGPNLRDPGLVPVYGKQPISNVIDIFTHAQSGVKVHIENLVDYTVTPQKMIEGANQCREYLGLESV